MRRWVVLANLIRRHRLTKVVELGVWQGKTMAYLLGTFPGLDYTGVDLYQVQPGGSCETYAPGENGHEWNHEAYYQSALALADGHPSARFLRMDTAEAAQHFDDSSVDLVFIDADHSYDGITKDILAWEKKIRDGGFITGHDYSPDFPGVVRAVDERYPRAQQLPDTVWAYQIPKGLARRQ